MVVNVEMLAFRGPGVIREVVVPDASWNAPGNTDNDLLELVFHFGQNDIQPSKEFPSVSMGDVIDMGNAKFEVDFIGFKKVA